MLDHHHAERLGTKYKAQSTTEIETSSHGSEVCNCRVQRVFFSLGRITIAAPPLTIAASLRKKKPSGTQGTAKIESCTFTSRAQHKLEINFKLPAKQLRYTLSAGHTRNWKINWPRVALKARKRYFRSRARKNSQQQTSTKLLQLQSSQAARYQQSKTETVSQAGHNMTVKNST